MAPNDTYRRHISDLKQFARAEMARELAKRHGRELRLPWDPEPTSAAVTEQAPDFDLSALDEIPDGD